MVIKKIKEKIEKTEKSKLIAISMGFGLLAGIIFGYVIVAMFLMNAMELPFIPLYGPKAGIQISTADLTTKVETYLTTNFLQEYKAIAKVTNTTKFRDISVMDVDIIQGGTVLNKGQIYVTNNGELLIIGALYNMSQKIDISQMQNTNTANPAADIPKTEKPDVKLFVMSFCPYGQQAETAMWPVLDLLGDKINFKLHYVFYPAQYYAGQEDKYCINKTYCAMHGIGELNENIRQICIMNNYNYSVWSNYIKQINNACSYSNVDTCWEGIAKANGIDVNAVKSCYEQNALTYAKQEYELNLQYGVQGSPMLFINEVEYGRGRTPESYKQGVCSGFNTEPSSCATKLSDTGTSVSGNCG